MHTRINCPDCNYNFEIEVNLIGFEGKADITCPDCHRAFEGEFKQIITLQPKVPAKIFEMPKDIRSKLLALCGYVTVGEPIGPKYANDAREISWWLTHNTK